MSDIVALVAVAIVTLFVGNVTFAVVFVLWMRSELVNLEVRLKHTLALFRAETAEKKLERRTADDEGES